MKITRKQLRHIIKEELSRLSEQERPPTPRTSRLPDISPDDAREEILFMINNPDHPRSVAALEAKGTLDNYLFSYAFIPKNQRNPSVSYEPSDQLDALGLDDDTLASLANVLREISARAGTSPAVRNIAGHVLKVLEGTWVSRGR